MTANKFRTLALSLADAIESAHMNHPDFRVNNKIFATLGVGEKWGVVMLDPDQQKQFIADFPEMFEPVKGGWGLKGATTVHLKLAKVTPVRSALRTAYDNIAS